MVGGRQGSKMGRKVRASRGMATWSPSQTIQLRHRRWVGTALGTQERDPGWRRALGAERMAKPVPE